MRPAGALLPPFVLSFAAACGLFAAACGGQDIPPPPPAPALVPAPAPPVASATATAVQEPPQDPAALQPPVTPEDAERVLFLATDNRTDRLRDACPVTVERIPRIRCLLGLRYAEDPESRKLALTLFEETGSLAGLLPEETSDDGHGGKVHLLPARPIAQNREHLVWILEAFRDYKRFLRGLEAHLPAAAPAAPLAAPGANTALPAPANTALPAPASAAPANTAQPAPASATPANTALPAPANTALPIAPVAASGAATVVPPAKVAFRDRPIYFRFFYSEKGGHPSAFAIQRNIGYNLFGALNVSDSAVRDTLFHEIFHLNDSRLGDWSKAALAPIHDAIVLRCGRRTACLAPYAPTDTLMNGVFYAFTDTTGAREYAAELGLRYYREHRLILEGKPLPIRPFKCGPPENLAAWRILSDALFGGVDLVPPC